MPRKRGENLIEKTISGYKYGRCPDVNGRDADWEPTAGPDFHATQARAGTAEKIEVLAQRVALGQPLWHADDPSDWSGFNVSTVSRWNAKRCKAPQVARTDVKQPKKACAE